MSTTNITLTTEYDHISITFKDQSSAGWGYSVKIGTKGVYHTVASEAQKCMEQAVKNLRGEVKVSLTFDDEDKRIYKEVLEIPEQFRIRSERLREAIGVFKYSCFTHVLSSMAAARI